MIKIINKNIIDIKLSDKEIFESNKGIFEGKLTDEEIIENYIIERVTDDILFFMPKLVEVSLEDLEENNVKN